MKTSQNVTPPLWEGQKVYNKASLAILATPTCTCILSDRELHIGVHNAGMAREDK